MGGARFSPSFSYDPTIVVDSTDAPYVTFIPPTSTTSAATNRQAVLRFNGTDWVPSASSATISTGQVKLSFDGSFVVGPSDTLYVSFLDDSDGDGIGSPVVMVGSPH